MPHILIVEDEAAIADTLIFALQGEGFTTTWLTLGQAALEHQRQTPADLLILDIGLPDITGYELAKRIRARLGERSCVLSALSGYGQPQDVAASRLAGMDFHLIKPLDYAKLRDVLDGISPRS